MPLSAGQFLHNQRYRIDALLGQGGMGAVYRAWDISLNIPVAIKENLDSSPEAQKQFGREAQILARLAHPNLPRVTDYFFLPGQGQYLVMDFVEGEDLQSMLQRLGTLPEPQALAWIGQVCDAVAYLHSQPSPIIHRDIKPANIRIRPDGRALLVDFGIAKVYDAYMATTMGAKAVSPGYSPPEQYGGGTTDVRSDVYALGATLYHLLTGRQLPESVQRAVGMDATPLPHQLNAQIGPSVEQAILKAVDVITDRRFQSVGAFAGALQQPAAAPYGRPATPTVIATQILPGHPPAPSSPPQPRAQPSLRTSPWTIVAAVLFGFVLVAILLWPLGLYDRVEMPAQQPSATALSIPSTQAQPTPPPASKTPVLSAPAPQPTARATARPQPTARATASPSPLPPAEPLAYRPSADESLNVPSLLSQVTYRDPTTPQTLTYPATVDAASTWRWGFSWCAIDSARLTEILKPLTVSFYVNGRQMPASAFLVHAYTRPSNGWQCQRWSTILTDWPSGKMVELEIRYDLSQGIYDGEANYSAGEYRQIFYVTVR